VKAEGLECCEVGKVTHAPGIRFSCTAVCLICIPFDAWVCGGFCFGVCTCHKLVCPC
jgi:hypothetical protein